MTVDERGEAAERASGPTMGSAPETRREQRIKLCWAGVYMLYMASTAGDLIAGHHTPVATVLGWLGLAAFVGPYLCLVLSRHPRTGPARWQAAVLGWLYVLAGVLTFTLGDNWLVLFIYVSIASGVMAPFRRGVWVVPFVS